MAMGKYLSNYRELYLEQQLESAQENAIMFKYMLRRMQEQLSEFIAVGITTDEQLQKIAEMRSLTEDMSVLLEETDAIIRF